MIRNTMQTMDFVRNVKIMARCFILLFCVLSSLYQQTTFCLHITGFDEDDAIEDELNAELKESQIAVCFYVMEYPLFCL